MHQVVFCVKCKEVILPTDDFCRFCGADQRPPAKRTPSSMEPTISYPVPPAPGYAGQQAPSQRPFAGGEPTISYPSPLPQAYPAPHDDSVRMHITILGWIHVVIAGMTLAFMTALATMSSAALGNAEGRGNDTGYLSQFQLIVLLFVWLTLYLLVGMGLLRKAGWSRIGGIVVSVLFLVGFPIGTIIGIYGLAVLTRPGAEAAFARRKA